MNFLTWVLVGGLLGWAATLLTRTSERKGILLNVGVGIAGVALGGILLSALLGSSSFNQGEFSLVGLLVSMQVAMVLLAAMQLLYPSLDGRTAASRYLIAYSRIP